MIDYKRWRDALAMTESNNKPEAWGDYKYKPSTKRPFANCPLACGRWQMHPCFVARWWPADDVREFTTWDELFELCLKKFFDDCAPQATSADQLAAWFHEHGGPGPVTDTGYLKRFRKFYGQD